MIFFSSIIIFETIVKALVPASVILLTGSISDI